MLSQEQNELLCRVGSGTPMGNLMRRYWMPAVLSAEVPNPDSDPVRVTLLGEKLIAFRDTSGRVGLIHNHCPHRGASLFFGRNEENGLRCVYHGWKFDVSGQCVDMPNEPAESNFKTKVKAVAYPIHESGGIVWAYMGSPAQVPPFRDFGTDALPKEEWRSSKQISYCNYVQTMEGNIDTAHISFLHRSFRDFNIPADDTDRPGYPSTQMSTVIRAKDRFPRLQVQDTPYGFRYAGIRTTPNGYTHIRMSVFIMPFTAIIANIPLASNHLMVVPIDDETCWRWSVTTQPNQPLIPGVAQRLPGIVQRQALPQNDYLIDRAAQKTDSYTGIQGIATQDLAVTESMGAIYDRSREHLGTTDLAIIRMRRMLIDAAVNLQKGIDPLGTDPRYAYREIRSAEKILGPGEDWTRLATHEDQALLRELETAATS